MQSLLDYLVWTTILFAPFVFFMYSAFLILYDVVADAMKGGD